MLIILKNIIDISKDGENIGETLPQFLLQSYIATKENVVSLLQIVTICKFLLTVMNSGVYLGRTQVE